MVIALQGTLRGIMKLTGAAEVDDDLIEAVEAKVSALDGVSEDAEFDEAALGEVVGALCGGDVTCASLLTAVGVAPHPMSSLYGRPV